MIGITIASQFDRERIVNALSGQNDFQITSIGNDGFHAIKSAQTQRPDIIIMDYRLTDIDSFALAPVIKRHSPSTGLIVLYSPDECEALNAAIRAGVSGCLQRQQNFDELASSVRSVFHGGLYLGGMIRNHVLRGFSFQSAFPHDIFRHVFSGTEQRIIAGIASGFSDKEIAIKMSIANGTISNCIKNIKNKTGLNNRSQISAYALFSGLINPATVKDRIVELLKKPE